MRIDMILPNEGPLAKESVQNAAVFEQMGFGGLWLTDHVVGFPAYAPTYYDYWLEIMTSMTYVAATTKTIRIGAGVLVVPYRDPVLTAKIVASIDTLSNGRVDLGIGTGWSRREYIALGVGDKFEPRGKVTDEYLDVMLKGWAGGAVDFEGQWSTFKGAQFNPTPVQNGRVPLWIGARGIAPAPLRRAAKYADVWHPVGLTPEELKSGGEMLDEMAGRKVARSIRYKAEGAETAKIADSLAAFEAVGAVQAAIDFQVRTSFSDFVKEAEAIAKTMNLKAPA